MIREEWEVFDEDVAWKDLRTAFPMSIRPLIHDPSDSTGESREPGNAGDSVLGGDGIDILVIGE